MTDHATLQDAILYFADFENCRKFMVSVLWPDGVVKCPRCGSEQVAYMQKAKLYFCKAKHPAQKFSLKVGTIFEDSPIGLDKWLPAFWLMVNCKNGISSYEMARALGVTQKSAWFMLHRIRESMKSSRSFSWAARKVARSKLTNASSAASRRTCTQTSGKLCNRMKSIEIVGF